MKTYRLSGLILALFILASQLAAQEEILESAPTHKSERSFTISLATSGLGIGGAYRFTLPAYFHLGFTLEFFIMRDDNELELYDPYSGRYLKLNDLNRLFLIPLNVELKKRLFVNDIEDDFRPHIVLEGGMVFGMNFPNEAFVDGNVIKPDNEYQFAPSLAIGVGVDFSTKKTYFATLRTQYRYTQFSEPIAGTKDHSAFEIKFEIGGQR